MTAKEFYKPIYEKLQNCTPLKKDCGILCDKACCKDGDEPTGMLLFPGEELLYSPSDDVEIEMSNCEYGEDKTARILFCNGKCDRKIRPLACRIFPLLPYLKDGKLRIVMDPRAKGICPLARSLKVWQLEPEFVEVVRGIANRVLKLKDGEDYIAMLSEIADEMENCRKTFNL